MSSCIKDLYDYNLVKNCSKCGIISLESNFHKNENMSDGFNPKCKFCRKKYYVDNQDRLINKQKFYNKDNCDQIIEYQKKYKKQNRDQIIKYQKNYNKQNREKLKIYDKKF